MESRSGLFPFITFTLIAISASDAQPTPRGPEGRGPEDRHNRVGWGVTRVQSADASSHSRVLLLINFLRTQWKHVFPIAAGIRFFSHRVPVWGYVPRSRRPFCILHHFSASQALGHPSAVRGLGIEGAAAGRALLVRGRELREGGAMPGAMPSAMPGAMSSCVCAARCARSRGLCAAIVDSRAM